MSTYINKGNEAFRDIRNGEYIDKSLLIAAVNATLNTERRFSCVTRCRRFGKSMAAEMLRAYYDESCHSYELFADLQIASDPTFRLYLNQFPVIYMDITNFTTKYPHDHTIVDHMQEDLIRDLLQAYPQIQLAAKDDLMDVLTKIVASTRRKFIMIIDEWDAICREFAPETNGMNAYINLLRRLFKGGDSKDVFAGVYVTGILPIKKYNTQSALNNFREYSMVDPGELASFFGFLPTEVKELANRHNQEMEELEKWYDGYQIGNEKSIYNPYSVMEASIRNRCRSYWNSTGTYDSLKMYIEMNFNGLKDDIISMLAGNHCPVDPTGFQNDMSVINSKDDVFTVLIHLGYLAYDWNEEKCYIPNKEVAKEMENAVKACHWQSVTNAIRESQQLLEATVRCDENTVANLIEQVHDEHTSILSYNDENSLSCVLSLAYYYAKNEYIIHRELATGKGFADLVMIPRRDADRPALLIELKYNQTAQTAIDQIKDKTYVGKLKDYTDTILLVGINYDKTTKRHSCKIESIVPQCNRN